MLKKLLIAVAVLLLAVVGFVLSRPATYTIERKASIAAPTELVFAQVNDFHNWVNWSPWDKLDPALKKTFEGPGSGTGASYAWTSEKDDVGSGKMTITEAKPNEKISIKLEFLKPFEATNPTTFTFRTAGAQTEVTWHMVGGGGMSGKMMNAFMNMDQMVGKDFDQGLASMKAHAEAEAKKAAAAAPPAEAPPAAPGSDAAAPPAPQN